VGGLGGGPVQTRCESHLLSAVRVANRSERTQLTADPSPSPLLIAHPQITAAPWLSHVPPDVLESRLSLLSRATALHPRTAARLALAHPALLIAPSGQLASRAEELALALTPVSQPAAPGGQQGAASDQPRAAGGADGAALVTETLRVIGGDLSSFRRLVKLPAWRMGQQVRAIQEVLARAAAQGGEEEAAAAPLPPARLLLPLLKWCPRLLLLPAQQPQVAEAPAPSGEKQQQRQRPPSRKLWQHSALEAALASTQQSHQQQQQQRQQGWTSLDDLEAAVKALAAALELTPSQAVVLALREPAVLSLDCMAAAAAAQEVAGSWLATEAAAAARREQAHLVSSGGGRQQQQEAEKQQESEQAGRDGSREAARALLLRQPALLVVQAGKGIERRMALLAAGVAAPLWAAAAAAAAQDSSSGSSGGGAGITLAAVEEQLREMAALEPQLLCRDPTDIAEAVVQLPAKLGLVAPAPAASVAALWPLLRRLPALLLLDWRRDGAPRLRALCSLLQLPLRGAVDALLARGALRLLLVGDADLRRSFAALAQAVDASGPGGGGGGGGVEGLRLLLRAAPLLLLPAAARALVAADRESPSSLIAAAAEGAAQQLAAEEIAGLGESEAGGATPLVDEVLLPSGVAALLQKAAVHM
jgi:hypothetical protein